MTRQVCISISILTLHFHLMAQSSNCTQTVRYDYLKPKLDPSICIPHGNHIITIQDGVDVNSDGLVDKVVRWQNITLADGDTAYYSIYVGNKDGKFSLRYTLGNLTPLYFASYEAKSENKFYDSIKRRYVHPTLSSVGFEANRITITFYVKTFTLKELFFTYSPEKNTWILTREIQWAAPTIYKSTHKVDFDRAARSPMSIVDFDMLKYLASINN